MQMNPNIILEGQQPNFLALIDGANRARQFQTDATQKNAFNDMLQQNGAGILQGDQNALAALAGFDPQAALGVKQTHQDLRFDAERMRLAAEEHARSVDADTLAKQAAEMEADLRGAAYFHAQGDRAGYDAYIREKGLDPNEYDFDSFPAVAAQAGEVLKVWESFKPEKPKPQTEAAQLNADLNADLITQEQYQAELARRAPRQTSLSYDPSTGQMSFNEGVGAIGQPTTLPYSPLDTTEMTKSIDEILNDPNLPRVTGPLEGGGGNNIDDLSAVRRMWYGEGGTALVEKIGQLQSTTWLSARQLLKGGGAITDYESKKAEAAMARLSRAKGEAEFKSALKDLRDAISEGAAKLAAAKGLPAASQTTPAPEGSAQPGVAIPPDLQGIYDKYAD